jgi:hypothetical protein
MAPHFERVAITETNATFVQGFFIQSVGTVVEAKPHRRWQDSKLNDDVRMRDVIVTPYANSIQ